MLRDRQWATSSRFEEGLHALGGQSSSMKEPVSRTE